MIKEEFYNSLRNLTRQKRYLKRTFQNIRTVLGEACNCDCTFNKVDRPIGNPSLEPCDTMIVSMSLEHAIHNMDMMFALQCVRPEELMMFAVNYICLYKPAGDYYENILFGH